MSILRKTQSTSMDCVRKRRGIALVAILAFVAMMTSVVALVGSFSRMDRQAGQNRTATLRGRWIAEGCAAAVLASIDARLHAANDAAAVGQIWSALDKTSVQQRSQIDRDCVLEMYPSGTQLNVNRIDKSSLRILIGTEVSDATADSMIDALIDWRDVDSIPLPAGAEWQWYRQENLPIPSNAAFENIAEVLLVRGWLEKRRALQYLTTDTFRIVPDRAPREILATIDSLPLEAIEWIDQHRSEVRGRDISVVAAHLSAAANATFAAHYAEYKAKTRILPEAWFLHVSVPNMRGRGSRLIYELTSAQDHVIAVRRKEEYL